MESNDPTVGDAIQNYINTKIPGAGMLTNYISIGEFIDENGESNWVINAHEDSTLRDSLGLLSWAQMDLDYQAGLYFDRIYGQGD